MDPEHLTLITSNNTQAMQTLQGTFTIIISQGNPANVQQVLQQSHLDRCEFLYSLIVTLPGHD